MDAFCLSILVKELNNKLNNFKISKISMPFSDEIFLQLYNFGKSFNLVISANSNLARLHTTQSIPKNPEKAFNFQNLLRKYLTNGTLKSISTANSERIVYFEVEAKNEMLDRQIYYIIFEMMGRVSNIILTTLAKKILGAINYSSLDDNSDRKILLGGIYSEPQQNDKLCLDDYENIAKLANQNVFEVLTKHIKGVSKFTAMHLSNLAYNCDELIQVLKNGIHLNACILKKEEKLFDVAPFNYNFDCFSVQSFDSFDTAIASFYEQKSNTQRLLDKSKPLLNILKKQIVKNTNKLAKIREKIVECENSEHYRILGELIISNIYLIKKGDRQIEVYNYYTDQNLSIELDEKLSAQENAKTYFKKSQKLKTAKKLSFEQEAETLAYLDNLNATMYALSEAKTLNDVDDIYEELLLLKLVKPKQKKTKIESEFLKFSHNGFDIFVGKNNIQNARLYKLMNSNDLWFHAHNTQGSHCYIKLNGKTVDNSTIEFTAKLAAKFSKSKNDSKVLVDYTQKRFVKKIPSSNLGLVTYSNEKTITVQP